MNIIEEKFEKAMEYAKEINKLNKQILKLTIQRDELKEKLEDQDKVLRYKIFFEKATEYKNQHQRELAIETERATDTEYSKLKEKERKLNWKLKELYDTRDLYYQLMKLYIAYLYAHKEGGNIND